MLSPRGDRVPSLKIMRFSMFSRFTFEQLQWLIPVTEKSLSEQCEGRLKCCATAKPEEMFRKERMCSVNLSANRRPVSPIKNILHRLHIMPCAMFLEIQVNGSVTLKDPLRPSMCMAEKLVTNLQVLQRLRLQEKVPAS